MTRYVAGMDGGGTKTALTILTDAGEFVRTFVAGPMNYNGQDQESIRITLGKMIDFIAETCGDLGNCQYICIGAAGISNPAVASFLTESVREKGYSGGLAVVGDHETALVGALDSPVGAIVIAGTGSICFGRGRDGITHRTGGGGHLVDDEGSGYSIGRDLIAAVLRASDGRLPETLITRLVYEKLRLSSIQELIGFVYRPQANKKDIAALAPILSEACMLGDQAALAIARKCAESLFELVVPVVERLRLQEDKLGLAGSVLLLNDYMRGALLDLITAAYPRLSCVIAPSDASLGAARMALARMADHV